MKSILVTGGHQSQAICERLLSDYPDTCIWLGSRDVKLGKEAREAIIEALGDEMRRRIQVVAMDTTLDSSVQVMAERLRLGGQKLYGIVHNAGVSVATRVASDLGFVLSSVLTHCPRSDSVTPLKTPCRPTTLALVV